MGTCFFGVCASSARKTAVSKPEKPVIASPTPSAKKPKPKVPWLFHGASDDQAQPSAPPLARMMMSRINSIVTPSAVSASKTRAEIRIPRYEMPPTIAVSASAQPHHEV